MGGYVDFYFQFLLLFLSFFNWQGDMDVYEQYCSQPAGGVDSGIY